MKVIARYPALAVGIPIGVLMAIAGLIGGGTVAQAAVSLAIVTGYAVLVTVMGRRSETVSVLAGRPVDERWEHINLEACAYTMGVSGIVVLVAFIVTDASGGAWQPYAFMAAVIALSYLGSLLVLRARH
jgi:hypothetical protein